MVMPGLEDHEKETLIPGPVIGRNLRIYQWVGGEFLTVANRPTGDRGNWQAEDLCRDRGAAAGWGKMAYQRSSSLGRYSLNPVLAHSRVRQIEEMDSYQMCSR